ncbi:MAG TPA: type II toxin-antitoxin system RelE/ParE family toxin [Anaerolineae bacterium]|nr:type II toxin-antitoxin system RelE/ParE family toxin [Anaerolineae bacterium]HOG45288.1 type II toxin-antitoxin system RelE/ParE family toxin [Anaerolineae bacterium]HOQ98285.1 type II toxin-antitoxin system RelE/ParE family toxin [Anaerolineae bacterium]HPL27610.1 type II toxin-antitoxin system RelE/ParE family toxin [Anaerolineae bacterium]
MAEPRRYAVKLSRQAGKMLERLPRGLAQQVTKALRGLEKNPRPHGAKKLTGYDLYRVRVCDWRIVYQVRDAQLLVLVLKLASRGDVYSEL